MSHAIDFITRDIPHFIAHFGYGGIFVMMFLESTVFPLPSELVMIPAGILAFDGEMNLGLVIFYGTMGCIGGASFNYVLARWLGRAFIIHYGKYIGVSEKVIVSTEDFFYSHGSISIFSGRLIPVVRHFIAIPAGFARMHLGKFLGYTLLGAGIWSSILTILGYEIGRNTVLLAKYQGQISIILAVSLVILIGGYILYHKRGKI